MRVGTKSVLFGAHCFFIHPFFVAFGWWALGQFPWDPRLWAAFFLHDVGYVFSPNMDGPEGEEHVHLGAKIMGLLFGDWWADFTLRHSRYWAKRNGVSVSKLCYADKLAFAMTPGWLYLPMARAEGGLAAFVCPGPPNRVPLRPSGWEDLYSNGVLRAHVLDNSADDAQRARS